MLSFPPQPETTSTIGPTITFWAPVMPCPDHQRVGCEHTYSCPVCGEGTTTMPDPCDAAAGRA